MKQRRLTMALLCMMAAGGAQAHAIWLERDEAGPARAYFGEFADDVREKTGGSLDRVADPKVSVGDAASALPFARKTDHIEIATPAKATGDVVLQEASFAPREDKQQGGRSKTTFFAKAGRTDTRARLELELVPLTPGASDFVLLLRGQPLPKFAVTLIGPPGWEKPLRTDEHGKVSLPTPWAGRYLAEAVHVDETPGELRGERYDRLRRVFTLSFVVGEGVPWNRKP